MTKISEKKFQLQEKTIPVIALKRLDRVQMRLDSIVAYMSSIPEGNSHIEEQLRVAAKDLSAILSEFDGVSYV